MVRAPCCEKMGLKRGPWTSEEDKILIGFIQSHGHSNWRALPKQAGLLRCGKSCRLRWTNYLSPNIKRGNFSNEEEEAIIKLHEMLGNRWSAIAARLPGRTDNEIKNVWNTHLKKRLNKKDTIPKTEIKTAKGLKCEKNEAKQVKFEAQTLTENSSLVSIQSSSDSSGSESSSSYNTSPSEEHNRSPEIKCEYNELLEDFFEIDENFWTAENLDIIDDFASPTHAKSESKSSSPCGLNLDDGMNFWFDLYTEPKLTELF